MATTYTVVIDSKSGMLISCSAGVGSIENEISRFEQGMGVSVERDDLCIYKSLTLVDEPSDDDVVVYSGFEMGHLSDISGTYYQYAVRKAC